MARTVGGKNPVPASVASHARGTAAGVRSSSLPAAYIDRIFIGPSFRSNRNHEVFWGETEENRVFKAGHARAA